ncbi:MAG: type II secretion system protein [Deltaproteobacteria bacterium]|nr:type II secretion system protein [Deltaproteobacteria bacterium]
MRVQEFKSSGVQELSSYVSCLTSTMLLVSCLFLLSGCAANRAFKDGAATAAKGDVDKAVDHYQKALSLEPNNLSYRIELEKARTLSARKHFANGDAYLKDNKYDAAEMEYQIALLMDPSFRKAEQMIAEVRKLKDSEGYYKKGMELLDANKTAEARTALKKAASLNPKNEAAKNALDKLKEVRTKLDGFELSLKSVKPITLKFRDTSIKEVFEIISKLSGINFIFDEDVKDQKISIFLQDATFAQTMELLLLTNRLFAKAVTENTVIIIPKNPAKAKQYQDLVIHTFYLSHIEAKKAVNLLRTMLQLKLIHVNEELNALIIRDEPERIKLAQKILEANDIPEAEVMMEVEIIEVSRDKLSELGLNLSTSSMAAGIYSGDPAASDKTFNTSMTYGDMKNLSAGANLLFSPIPQAVFNFKKTQGGVKTLANPKIRVLNHGKAKILIGDRIPVITSTAITGGATQTNVQYQEVGGKRNVEPTIHIEQDVTMKLSLEVSTIGTPLTDPDTKLVVAYQIGTRSAETVLNLRDGETQVIGGLIRDDERNTKVSIPLLGDIPILGRLFSTQSDQKSKTDILLAITPHVLRGLEVPSEDVTTIWSGKEDEFTNRVPFESFREKDEPQSSRTLPAPEEGAIHGTPPAGPSGAIPGPFVLPPDEGDMPPVAPQIQPSAGKGMVYMTAPKEVKVDQELTVGITIGEVTNLYGASINISYDPSLLEFVRVNEGSLLRQDGKPTSFMHAVNPAEGRVTVGITRLGAAGGTSGTGNLFSAVFKCKGEGTASINFLDAALKDPALATIPSTRKGVEVKITK